MLPRIVQPSAPPGRTPATSRALSQASGARTAAPDASWPLFVAAAPSPACARREILEQSLRGLARPLRISVASLTRRMPLLTNSSKHLLAPFQGQPQIALDLPPRHVQPTLPSPRPTRGSTPLTARRSAKRLVSILSANKDVGPSSGESAAISAEASIGAETNQSGPLPEAAICASAPIEATCWGEGIPSQRIPSPWGRRSHLARRIACAANHLTRAIEVKRGHPKS